jgi:hypothetical protein
MLEPISPCVELAFDPIAQTAPSKTIARMHSIIHPLVEQAFEALFPTVPQQQQQQSPPPEQHHIIGPLSIEQWGDLQAGDNDTQRAAGSDTNQPMIVDMDVPFILTGHKVGGKREREREND